MASMTPPSRPLRGEVPPAPSGVNAAPRGEAPIRSRGPTDDDPNVQAIQARAREGMVFRVGSEDFALSPSECESVASHHTGAEMLRNLSQILHSRLGLPRDQCDLLAAATAAEAHEGSGPIRVDVDEVAAAERVRRGEE